MNDGRRINGWIDLMNLVAEYSPKHRQEGWLFRGLSECGYELTAAIGRKEARKDPSTGCEKPFDPGLEKKALDEFQRISRPYLSKEPEGKLDWLAIAQHHGMPTRLLDWSEGLLVAAYFACRYAGTKGDAAICALQVHPTIPEASPKDDPFANEGPRVYRPRHLTPRIPSQQSVFVIHNRPDHPFEHASLFKFVVESTACWPIKQNLDACGINEHTIYADLDGSARYVGWRYKWSWLR